MMQIAIIRFYYFSLIASLVATVALKPLRPLLKHGKIGSGTLHVNKNLFIHFYAVGIVACFVSWNWQLVSVESRGGGEGRVALFLLMIQTSRRFAECLFIQNNSNSTMHVGHYLVGLSFYIVTSLAVWIDFGLEKRVDWNWTREVRITLGIVLFVWASRRQYQSHVLLANLRSQRQNPLQSRVYSLPRGGPFSKTLFPHYSSEMLIYTAIFIIAPSMTTLLLLVWTIANLTVSAHQGMNWYREKFGVKVNGLSRLIPGVY
jgi:3-oxo-5-alpha-steroid 4-dehydrogenase 3